MHATSRRAPDPDSPEGLGNSASAAAPPVAAGNTRVTLDRRTILLAAITLIDRHDLRHLTMRRLGAHLGVEGMALYHYIHGREDLLDGIVELVIDDLYGDPDVHLTATHWQDYLQRLAHGVRRIALAHPQVFPLVATRPPAAPWVRPPLRSLRWMESFLETLHRHILAGDPVADLLSKPIHPASSTVGRERRYSAPRKVDVTTPHPARVHDYLLGGIHNFAADRELGERLRRLMPGIDRVARLNEAFLRRSFLFLSPLLSCHIRGKNSIPLPEQQKTEQDRNQISLLLILVQGRRAASRELRLCRLC